MAIALSARRFGSWRWIISFLSVYNGGRHATGQNMMKKSEEIRKIFHETSYRNRRVAEFEADFLIYSEGVGANSIRRLREIFPKKIKLTEKQRFELMVDVAWSTSSLEGNLFSHLDTEKFLKRNVVPKNASAEDTQMIINHQRAFELTFQDPQVSLQRLRDIHRIVSDPGELTGETKHFVLKSERGEIRTTEHMNITGTAYCPPYYEPGQNMQTIYNLISSVMDNAAEINDPLESAFYILTRVPYIQAFFDANKRTSRMMANTVLAAHKELPNSFEMVKKDDYEEAMLSVYEFTDTEIFREIFISTYSDTLLKYYPFDRNTSFEINRDIPGYRKAVYDYIESGENSKLVQSLLSLSRPSNEL